MRLHPLFFRQHACSTQQATPVLNSNLTKFLFLHLSMQGLDNHVPHQHSRGAGVVLIRQGRRSHGGSSGCHGNSPRWNRLLDPSPEPMRQPLRFPHGRGRRALLLCYMCVEFSHASCRSLKAFGVYPASVGLRCTLSCTSPHGFGFRCVIPRAVARFTSPVFRVAVDYRVRGSSIRDNNKNRFVLGRRNQET